MTNKPLWEQGAGIAGTQCDFCNSPDIAWAYPAESFSFGMAGMDEHNNIDKENSQQLNSWGGWAACDVCHQLIEAGADKELAKRSCEINPEIQAGLTDKEKVLQEAILFAMHEQFRAARTGPCFAWRKGDPLPGPYGPPERDPDGPQPEGQWVRK